MTATNHALTGALIGLAVSNTAVALPVAFFSHFLLDSLPHFGFTDLKRRDRLFGIMLFSDFMLCVILVLLLFLSHDNWIIVSLAAFLATSPDFMWMPDYVRETLGKPQKGITNVYMMFHSKIQWYQKPQGAWLESVYGLGAVVLLLNLL